MMRVVAVGVALLLGGCATKQWTLTKTYTSHIIATQEPQNALTMEVPASLVYSEEHAVRQGAVSEPSAGTTRSIVPIPLTVVNRTSDIVTVDWDHSVFVDATGNSYKLIYPGSSRLPASVEAIKKPPTPVVAPRAHLSVSVHPDAQLSDGSFFMPWSLGEKAELRIILATTGTQSPHSEVGLAITCVSVTEHRSEEPAWPVHGEPCLPVLGCAEGHTCQGHVCVAPGKPLPAPPAMPVGKW